MTLSKIMFTLLFLAFILSSFSQGVIPNQNFEAWTSNTSPKNWESSTLLLPPGYVTCQRTTSSYNGDYAIELTTIDMDGWLVPGVITLGEIGIGFTSGGIGFSEKPESLKGFIRHPSSGDQVMVIVQFFKNGVETGSGFWSTTDSIPDFTEFNVPISFQNSENPDTLNITILTDQNIPGSSITLDALQFEYTATPVENNTEKAGISIYPNPCRDVIFMNTPSGIHEFEAEIFDLAGRSMIKRTGQSVNQFDTSGLPEGIYFLILRTLENTYRGKFIKQ